ncbi:uncharacterized protein ACA1_072240 [Acanthamoeba castellanii str. Neff]|uniref:Uncharacterized protein n=1 Tax=Acanthamoeba castellanii (strain ATCC 30010 / Neff) TaxID=1257118 RepID=L8HEG3_ACACF|nr:uncharacterized protein ACA1_072240 [Acanthamoeba castellanii str. Neff]ELR23602.1 hypothetical protein ACA1_072240 [Acanthamoeba castellanii str. Neff]
MTHLIYRAKLELVDSDRGLDRWQADDPSSHRYYAMYGHFEWPGDEFCGNAVLPRNLEGRLAFSLRGHVYGDKSTGQVAFYGITITHYDAPALRTSVPGDYDSTHVDCSAGAGEAACWLTAEQKAAILRFLQEELGYHGPYEWVVALNTA